MTESNWRELCEELTGWIERSTRHYVRDPDVLTRARAALAEPVAEGPTDEELLDLDDLERAWNAQADAANSWDELGLDEIIVWAQRQALARWGRPAPAPAEGEVAELVAWLRANALTVQKASGNPANGANQRMNRAAALLEQRHPAPVPAGMIPVEYWDIDSGARIVTEPSEEEPGGCWVVLNSRLVNPFTEFPTAEAAWNALRAATALLLPQGEVQP